METRFWDFLGLGWFLKSGGKIRFKKLYVDIIMVFFISNKENRSSDHYTVDMYNSAV